MDELIINVGLAGAISVGITQWIKALAEYFKLKRTSEYEEQLKPYYATSSDEMTDKKAKEFSKILRSQEAVFEAYDRAYSLALPLVHLLVGAAYYFALQSGLQDGLETYVMIVSIMFSASGVVKLYKNK